MKNQIEMIFRQNETDGKTALRFIVGCGIIIASLWMWWHGWFSAIVCETDIAPERLQSSYNARAVSLQSTGHEPMGSTGALSIVFDMIVLLGMTGIAVWNLMWEGVSLVWNGGKHIVRGWYANADQSLQSNGQLGLPDVDVFDRVTEMSRAGLTNHEQRLRIIEDWMAEHFDMDSIERPMEAKAADPQEIIDDQASLIAELEERVRVAEAKKKPTRTPSEQEVISDAQ